MFIPCSFPFRFLIRFPCPFHSLRRWGDFKQHSPSRLRKVTPGCGLMSRLRGVSRICAGSTIGNSTRLRPLDSHSGEEDTRGTMGLNPSRMQANCKLPEPTSAGSWRCATAGDWLPSAPLREETNQRRSKTQWERALHSAIYTRPPRGWARLRESAELGRAFRCSCPVASCFSAVCALVAQSCGARPRPLAACEVDARPA